MARKTIFDILEGKMDINFEISKIEELCRQHVIEFYDGECVIDIYTLEEYVDIACLPKWKNRNRSTSCKNIRERLGITSAHVKRNLNEDQVLIYLEFLANLIRLFLLSTERYDNVEYTQSFEYLQRNVSEVIEELNYEEKVFDLEEKVLLVEKNAAATAVAEILEPELAYEVIEYNHFLLKGDIEQKRKILVDLANKVEPIRAEFKKRQIHKDLESNVGFLLNKMNIRHNNLSGRNAVPYVQNMSDAELEEWYDETYQMLLLCILEHDNIERNNKVSELKKIIEK